MIGRRFQIKKEYDIEGYLTNCVINKQIDIPVLMKVTVIWRTLPNRTDNFFRRPIEDAIRQTIYR